MHCQLFSQLMNLYETLKNLKMNFYFIYYQKFKLFKFQFLIKIKYDLKTHFSVKIF